MCCYANQIAKISKGQAIKYGSVAFFLSSIMIFCLRTVENCVDMGIKDMNFPPFMRDMIIIALFLAIFASGSSIFVS